MNRRPATTEEIAERFVGRRASFEHGIYETGRMQRGRWVTVHRSRSTAKIERDDKGVYALRKGQREYLTADVVTYEGVKPFVALLRAAYLRNPA